MQGFSARDGFLKPTSLNSTLLSSPAATQVTHRGCDRSTISTSPKPLPLALCATLKAWHCYFRPQFSFPTATHKAGRKPHPYSSDDEVAGPGISCSVQHDCLSWAFFRFIAGFELEIWLDASLFVESPLYLSCFGEVGLGRDCSRRVVGAKNILKIEGARGGS